jgi:hypothetical protein
MISTPMQLPAARPATLRFYRSGRILTALLALLVSLSSRAEHADGWIRFLVDIEEFQNRPGIPFIIASTRYDDYTLSAAGWYRYTEGRDPVVLHGKKEPDGMFRPVVTYEVATEDQTKWKMVAEDVEQLGSDSITVSPDHPMAKVTVNMEPFRRCVGIFRYGRLVLESGDAAIVEIEDLLPTAAARGSTGDFREDVIGGDLRMRQQGFKQPGPSDPAHLSSVTSLAGRLIGDFIFSARSEKAVSLDGTRTLDGDFWPTVTFQVGNSDTAWETIEKSQHSGTPAKLEIPSGKAQKMRILLTDYKPLIGKYKYGRIVFSDGESGVFYLDLLNPKK